MRGGWARSAVFDCGPAGNRMPHLKRRQGTDTTQIQARRIVHISPDTEAIIPYLPTGSWTTALNLSFQQSSPQAPVFGSDLADSPWHEEQQNGASCSADERYRATSDEARLVIRLSRIGSGRVGAARIAGRVGSGRARWSGWVGSGRVVTRGANFCT